MLDMKKILAVLCTACIFAVPSAFAQATAPTDPALTAAVRELMEVTGSRKMMTVMMDQMTKQMPAHMEQGMIAAINANKKLNAAQKKEALATVSVEVKKGVDEIITTMNDPVMLDELFAEMTPLYARHFTLAEIKEITAFYRTPVGAKMLRTMPALMNEAMQVSQKVMMPRLNAAMQKITQGK